MQNMNENAQSSPARDSYEVLKDQMGPLKHIYSGNRYDIIVSGAKTEFDRYPPPKLRTCCLCRRCGRSSHYVRLLCWRIRILKVRRVQAYELIMCKD